MRRSEDFRRTVRHGVRAGRRTVVVHALRRDVTSDAASMPDQAAPLLGSLVGFVVSKSVGSAVRRNRVRRRLRHLARPHFGALERSTLVVVRALPPAATAGADLDRDLDAAWTAALVKLDRQHQPARAGETGRR